MSAVAMEEATTSDEASAAPSRNKSRSVNDFDTADGLRTALKQKDYVEAFVDFGRDFPKAMSGSELGVPRHDDDSVSECSVDHDPELDWVLTNYNAEISQTQNLEEELKRLQVLKSYLMLDSEREANFERLTALASRMFHVPIALVSLVDLGRQWFMSNRGLGDVRETPRKLAFCAHAVLSKEDFLIVPDATKDPRFCDNPLVTGAPMIRFYGGAPLLCPEGYRLGTLCLIDSKPRPSGLGLEEKQNLREMAALVMDAMVERRRDKMRVLQDKSQIIATTAHDLLTPLTGCQMSLSVLMDDEDLRRHIPASSRDLLETAAQCSDVMNRICRQAIETFRGDVAQYNSSTQSPNEMYPSSTTKGDKGRGGGGPRAILIQEMVKNLNMVMEPYPKKVPLLISVDPLVPPEIIGDDLKIFRSVINYLTNACKKTEEGSVQLKIYVAGRSKRPKLVFECEDTGPGVPMETYPYLFRPFREDDGDPLLNSSGRMECIRVDEKGDIVLNRGGTNRCNSSNMTNSGLGLYSVANQISAIGGDYGFRPREVDGKVQGAIFWFSIPMVVPNYLNWSLKAKRSELKKHAKQKESAASPKTTTIQPPQPTSSSSSPTTKTRTSDSSTSPPPRPQPPAQSTTSPKPMDVTPTTPMTTPVPMDTTTTTTSTGNDNMMEDGEHVDQKIRVVATTPMNEADVNTVRDAVNRVLLDDDDGSATTAPTGGSGGAKPMQTTPTVLEKPGNQGTSPRSKTKAVTSANGMGVTARVRQALVIDDSLVIRKSMVKALTKLGFKVAQASNGLEGLKELQARVYDVVLCDFLMPVMDGLDCVQQYRDWEEMHRPWFRQHIIGISAHASAADAEKGKRAGMNSFKAKPITMKYLKELDASETIRSVSKTLSEVLKVQQNGNDDDMTVATDSVRSTISEYNAEESRNKKKAKFMGRQPVCLVGGDATQKSTKLMTDIAERRGWQAVVVNDGEDALRLLKMRNWDAVFLEDEMPRLTGERCLARFRDWEREHRVARQSNMIFVSNDYVPTPSGGDSTMNTGFPAGFNGVLGKPILVKDLMTLLVKAESAISDSSSSTSIVAR